MSTSIETWEQRISSADEAATMRAGVLFGVERVEVRDVPLPVIREHDVLVRVSAVGLCGTDAHIFAGHANYNTDEYGQPIPFDVQPQILGHEISGRIEEIGSFKELIEKRGSFFQAWDDYERKIVGDPEAPIVS